jgi:hypothetical protein
MSSKALYVLKMLMDFVEIGMWKTCKCTLKFVFFCPVNFAESEKDLQNA